MSIVDEARKFFQYAIGIDCCRPLFKEFDKGFLFRNSDGPSFIVEFLENEVKVKKNDGKNDTKKTLLGLESNTLTYLKLFRGVISPATAYHNREIYFDGIPYKEYPKLTRVIKTIQQELPSFQIKGESEHVGLKPGHM